MSMRIIIVTLIFSCVCLNVTAQQVSTPWAEDKKIGIGTDTPEAELSVKGELQIMRTSDDAFSPSSKISFQSVNSIGQPKNWYVRNEHENSESPNLLFYEEEGRPRFQINGNWGWTFYDENYDPELYSEGSQGGGIYIPGSLSVGNLSAASFSTNSVSASYFHSQLITYSGNEINLQSPYLKYKAGGGTSVTNIAHEFTVATALTSAYANIATFSNGGTALVKIDKSGNIISSGKITVTGDVSTEGKMKIGTGTLNIGTHALAVNGSAIFTKAQVKLNTNWPNYVFESGYDLPSLLYIEAYIQEHKHLPGVPSAKEVEENGIDLGDNQSILLKKIEELTLYIIEQEKRIKALEQKLINR